MKYFENNNFKYENNILCADGKSIAEIAKSAGTPFFLYSNDYFKARVKQFHEAFSGLNPQVFYAVKANNNIHVIKAICEAGCGADVNSAGELYRALQAGVPTQKIIFAGVGKTDDEIAYALKSNIKLIKAESRQEVEAINAIAGSMNKKAPVALRVNPDVDAGTHPHISTGLANNKFGLPFNLAKEIFLSNDFPNVNFTGVDMHLGSQITQASPYFEAVEKAAGLIKHLSENGLTLSHMDMGGGFGVNYSPADSEFDLSIFAARLKTIVAELPVKILFEPGRFFTANGGVLITKVLYRKTNGDKNFVVVDAAMSELTRPALYSAYHHVQPVTRKPGAEDLICDVVGPICESSDFFAKSREIEAVERGDLLAVCSAGAYGMAMSSNYNARLRPAELMTSRNELSIIRRREKLEDLIIEETLK